VLRKDDAASVITPQLEALSFEELFAGDVEAIADPIAEQHLEKLFPTKNTECEGEYRFIVRSPADEYVHASSALVTVCRGPGPSSKLCGTPTSSGRVGWIVTASP
jgi:hypothetical protein